VKRVFFVLNFAFAMAFLDVISCVHHASFVIVLPKYLKYSTFSVCVWLVMFCNGDGCLEILITLVFFHISYHLRVSFPSVMCCSIVSSLTNSTVSSAYFTVWITFPPFRLSEPFNSFCGNILAVQVEQNQWQIESLSNSSSKLHTSFLSLVQSHFLIHVQFADSCLLHHWNNFPLWSALTLNLPMTTIVVQPFNVIKWQLKFNPVA